MHQPSEQCDDWQDGHEPGFGQLPPCGQLPMCEYDDGQVGQLPPNEIPPGIGPLWQIPDGQDWQTPNDCPGPPALQPHELLEVTPGTAGL
tara:strand:+ start:224453 stop:224722 length:270 start_codon:yes stop_codon:yes gene_type:complete